MAICLWEVLMLTYQSCGLQHELGYPTHCRKPSDIWCTGRSSSKETRVDEIY